MRWHFDPLPPEETDCGFDHSSNVVVDVHWDDEVDDPVAVFTLNISVGEAVQFDNARAAHKHPFARPLFGVSGVAQVEAQGHEVVITKKPLAYWPVMVPLLARVLQENLAHTARHLSAEQGSAE